MFQYEKFVQPEKLSRTMIYLLIFLITCAVFWYKNKYDRRNKLLDKFPAAKKYPLIHNTLEFYNKSVVEIFNWMEVKIHELGPVFVMTMHPFDNGDFVVADVSVAESILSSQKILDKGVDYDLLKNWLGTGLLISTGKKWHQRRKIITPAFHFSILEKFVEVMDEQGKIFVEKMKEHDGKVVDVFPLAGLYALDVICESAMGAKINAQKGPSEYIAAVKLISEIMMERSFSLFNRSDFFFQFSSKFQEYEKCLKVLHDFTNNIILKRREEILDSAGNIQEQNADAEGLGIKKKKVFLDILLQSTIEGSPLTDADIREEVDTFMFEGHDTTTSAISFTLYNIAKYPEVQKKIYQEVRDEIIFNQKLTTKELSRLQYLELVIKESLRLYPSVPFYARKLLHGDLTVGKWTFPKNSSLYISPYFMGRDEKYFENAYKFMPERFDVEKTAEKINPYAYVPFSAGSRNCIGQKFAMNELKSILCKMVQNFEFQLADANEELQLYSELILKSANGVKLIPKIRKPY